MRRLPAGMLAEFFNCIWFSFLNCVERRARMQPSSPRKKVQPRRQLRYNELISLIAASSDALLAASSSVGLVEQLWSPGSHPG